MIQFYGFIPAGKRYAEVLVTKPLSGERSTQSETGVTYTSFSAAEKAVGDKNREIARQRYGR